MSKTVELLFLMGTTGVGKSELAALWAQRRGGAIVNCDSIQVYQGLNIGAAKPSPEVRRLIPHWLYDFVPPGEGFTAGQFRRQALDIIEREGAQRPLIFVGGSGFYFQALEKGMYPIGPTDTAVMENLQQQMSIRGLDSLYQELCERDPIYGHQLNPQDKYRILRGLAIIESHGRTVSEIKAAFEEESRRDPQPFSYRKAGLYLDKPELAMRVRERVEKMLQQGLLAEVGGLLAQGLGTWAPLNSVGYKECVQALRESWDSTVLIEEIVKNTMKLAKRQRTWFKRDRDIRWFHAAREQEQALNYLL